MRRTIWSLAGLLLGLILGFVTRPYLPFVPVCSMFRAGTLVCDSREYQEVLRQIVAPGYYMMEEELRAVSRAHRVKRLCWERDATYIDSGVEQWCERAGVRWAIFSLVISGAGKGTGITTPSRTTLWLEGTTVNLVATPAADSAFAGWSGDAVCTDARVEMTVPRTCTATFNPL